MKINQQTNIQICGIDIEQVSENKFLGVTIDNKLNWKHHVNNVKSKLSEVTAIMSKMKAMLDQRSPYKLYCSLKFPHISYCLKIWGNTNKTNLHQIFLLQKKVIRTISKVGYEPTKPLFIELRILEMYDKPPLPCTKHITSGYLSVFRNCSSQRKTYNLMGTGIFRTTKRSHCTSIKGVT